LHSILSESEYSFSHAELDLGAMHAVPLRRDLHPLFNPRPCCVLIPDSAEKAAITLKLLTDMGIPVTIRGGGTDPSGGSLITAGEALLVTRGIAEPPQIDPDASSVTAAAGFDMDALERYLNAAGFTLGILPRNRSGTTLGGFLSGPGWGEGSLGRGSLHKRVLGITLATTDGLQRDLNADDPQIPLDDILGGEGQFGLITTVKLAVENLFGHPCRYVVELARETDFPGLVMELTEDGEPGQSLLMFSSSYSQSMADCSFGNHGRPLALITTRRDLPGSLPGNARVLKPDVNQKLLLNIRSPHRIEGGSVISRMILPGELTAMLSDMSAEGEPRLCAAMEAIERDRYLVHLVVPFRPHTRSETAAFRRMWETRERLVSHGAEPSGYGFWQQGELASHKGEYQLRALRALKKRFDLRGKINRGRTLELRTKHDTLVKSSVLKPGAMRITGLWRRST
jgi:FAD/FMN-containing dehydrogenase